MNDRQILSKNAQTVQDAFDEKNIQMTVVELPSSTRTAQDAAQTIGCTIGQIVKSLIFKVKNSNIPLLVLASGPNRVDESLIEAAMGESIVKADANFTKEVTGFSIGGIPPVGHKQDIRTFIDEDLMNFKELWAAAGMPNAVFSLKPDDLLLLTKGTFIKVH